MPEPLHLSLPPIFRETVHYLESLSDENFAAFMKVVSDTPPSLSTEETLERLSKVLPPGPGGSVTSLLEFALSTRRLTSSFDTTVRTVSLAVTEAYRRAVSRDKAIAVGQDDPLLGRVIELLDSTFISLRAKAGALSSEADLRLDDCICITDLRPIFSPEGHTDGLSGFVIVHTLKLDVSGEP